MTKGKTGSPERDLRFGGSSVALGSALNGQRSTLGHLAALPDTQNPYNKYTNGDADKDSIDDGIHMGNSFSLPSALFSLEWSTCCLTYSCKSWPRNNTQV